jgi:hypothetical protein
LREIFQSILQHDQIKLGDLRVGRIGVQQVDFAVSKRAVAESMLHTVADFVPGATGFWRQLWRN